MSFAFLPLKLAGPLNAGFPSPLSTSGESASSGASALTALTDSAESLSSLRPPFLALPSRAAPDALREFNCGSSGFFELSCPYEFSIPLLAV